MLVYLGLALLVAVVAFGVGMVKHTRDLATTERIAKLPPRPATPDEQRWTPDDDAWAHDEAERSEADQHDDTGR